MSHNFLDVQHFHDELFKCATKCLDRLLAGGTRTDLFTSVICVFPGAHRQVEPQRHCPTSHVHVGDGAQQAHIVVVVVGVEARVVENLQCPVACPHRAVCDAHRVHHHQPGGHLKHVVPAATAVLHRLLHRLYWQIMLNFQTKIMDWSNISRVNNIFLSCRSTSKVLNSLKLLFISCWKLQIHRYGVNCI